MLEGTFSISSTLDSTTGLLSKYAYNEGAEPLPIVVLIHGYNLTIDAISDTILRRIANKGYFAVAIGMRGRKGASGNRDSSAKEIHDIYDGINHIKANFPVSDKVIVSGYSGGGGNALAFAVKFPFVANTIVNHFGMVDYGFDETESWYVRNDQYRDQIESFVGYARNAQNINYYRSRNAYEALGNIQSKVFNYHDAEDTGVSVELTNYLTSGLQSLGKTHETHISTATDSVRYTHDMGASKKSEGDWLPHGVQAVKPSTPNTGSFRAIGYLVTDDFKILLGNLDDHVADVSYNLTDNTFSINPLSGAVDVKVMKDGLQQTINVSQETSFTFEGEEVPQEPSGPPKDIKRIFIKENGGYIPAKSKYIKTGASWKSVK